MVSGLIYLNLKTTSRELNCFCMCAWPNKQCLAPGRKHACDVSNGEVCQQLGLMVRIDITKWNNRNCTSISLHYH